MLEAVTYLGQVRIEEAFGGYLFLLSLGVLTAYFCRAREGFVAWIVLLVGSFVFLVSCMEGLSLKESVRYVSLVFMLGSTAFLLLAFLFFVRRLRKRRKAVGAARKRSLEFTLPDRKNEYLRERLNGALKAREEERSETGVNLEYVRGLLAKLKAAPLAAVERLQAEELSRQITVYCSKDGLTAEEKRGLSDCFSLLINLSAKYNV